MIEEETYGMKLKLPKLTIRGEGPNVHVLIDDREVLVTGLMLNIEAGRRPQVTLSIMAGEVEIDAEALVWLEARAREQNVKTP